MKFFPIFLLAAGLGGISNVVAAPTADDVFAAQMAEVHAGAFWPEAPAVVKKGEGWTISFPAAEDVAEIVNDDGSKTKIVEKIPAATMEITRAGNFGGKPMYRAYAGDVARLQSFLYGNFMLGGVKAQSYREETYFVPELAFVASVKAAVQNLVLSRMDPKSGLKDEFAKAASADFATRTEEDEEIAITTRWTAKKVDVKTALLSASIPEFSYNTISVYDKNAAKNYRDIMDNFDDFKSFSLKLSAPKTTITVPMLQQNMRAGLKSTATMKSNPDNGLFRMKGGISFYNIEMPEVSDTSVKKVNFRYDLSDIKMDTLRRFQELRQAAESNADEQDYSNMILQNMDKFWSEVKLKLATEITFARGKIKIKTGLKRDGRFVVGNGKIVLIDFDQFAPDYTAVCEAEMQKADAAAGLPEACTKFSTFSILRPFVDMQKRKVRADGKTVDEINIFFTKDGVFVGGQKVADALAPDFSDIVPGQK